VVDLGRATACLALGGLGTLMKARRNEGPREWYLHLCARAGSVDAGRPPGRLGGAGICRGRFLLPTGLFSVVMKDGPPMTTMCRCGDLEAR